MGCQNRPTDVPELANSSADERARRPTAKGRAGPPLPIELLGAGSLWGTRAARTCRRTVWKGVGRDRAPLGGPQRWSKLSPKRAQQSQGRRRWPRVTQNRSADQDGALPFRPGSAKTGQKWPRIGRKWPQQGRNGPRFGAPYPGRDGPWRVVSRLDCHQMDRNGPVLPDSGPNPPRSWLRALRVELRSGPREGLWRRCALRNALFGPFRTNSGPILTEMGPIPPHSGHFRLVDVLVAKSHAAIARGPKMLGGNLIPSVGLCRPCGSRQPRAHPAARSSRPFCNRLLAMGFAILAGLLWVPLGGT